MRQYQLAQKLRIATSSLNELIHGKTRWDLDRAVRFAEAIGKPVRFLITATPREIKDAIKAADAK